MRKFWVVRVEDGVSPEVCYEIYGDAKKEAERLIHRTGKTVYLLEALEVGRPGEVMWKPLGGETPPEPACSGTSGTI